MVKCPFCDSEFDVELFRPDDGNLVDDLASNGGEEWDEKELYGMAEYQCESCGGNIYSEETTSATLCPFCGNTVILKGRLTGVLKPDKVIPFKTEKMEALKNLAEHYENKRFVPKKFKLYNKLEEIKGLYVPFWIYDAELKGDVLFQGVDVRRWRSGDTEYTERKYYHVQRKGDIAFDHVPADGSSKMPDDLMESIEPFYYDESVDFTTAYLSGFVADKYDIDQEQVRPRVRERLKEGTADQFMTTVHGYDEVSVMSTSIEAVSSNVDYVLYPVWLMNTEWDGKKFTFAMNGQTGKTVGDLPADMLKLVACTLGTFALLLAIITGVFGMIYEDLWSGFYLGVFVGFCSGIAFYSHYRGALKSVKFQHGARNYYREGSMYITFSQDVYHHRTVTSRKIK
jgi:predicted RNA-binding Zn-ribbon protein involved in translation (DUF1610 family)